MLIINHISRHQLVFNHSSLNLNGNVCHDRTGKPFFFAGFHLGMSLMMRSTSLPQPPPISLT
ncbi:MAG: hypothetical protein WA004_01955, partial [Saprospiraceae bacterium]